MCERRAALLALLALVAAGRAGAEPSAALVPLPFSVAQFRGPDSEVATGAVTSGALSRGAEAVVVWGADGRAAALTLKAGAVTVTPLGEGLVAELARAETPRGAVPDSRRLRAGPLTATLAEPVRVPEPHGALGGSQEAGALVIQERRPVPIGGDPKPVPVATTRIEAGPGAVFEDRTVRAGTLGGRTFLAVVRSNEARGASLALVGKGEGPDAPWRVVAETPPTGEAKAWLNPAALADFTGSGEPQVALVRAPHRDGVLQLWSLAGTSLTLKGEAPGYANHVFGSSAQDLAALLPAGSGPPELAIPTGDRGAIAIVGFKGGLRERTRIPLPAPAATGVAVLGQGRDAHVLVGLADGRVADLRP